MTSCRDLCFPLAIRHFNLIRSYWFWKQFPEKKPLFVWEFSSYLNMVSLQKTGKHSVNMRKMVFPLTSVCRTTTRQKPEHYMNGYWTCRLYKTAVQGETVNVLALVWFRIPWGASVSECVLSATAGNLIAGCSTHQRNKTKLKSHIHKFVKIYFRSIWYFSDTVLIHIFVCMCMCNHTFDFHLKMLRGFLKLTSAGQLCGFDEFASRKDHTTAAAAHFLWLAQS